MKRANKIFKSKLGISPSYMRPPYGSIDKNILNILNKWGYGSNVRR